MSVKRCGMHIASQYPICGCCYVDKRTEDNGDWIKYSDYATLLARHNALVEAVKWMLYIDTPENFEGGKHIKARAEVERLLSEESKNA